METLSTTEIIQMQERYIPNSKELPTPPRLRLTPQQRAFYDENGYLLVKNLFTQDEMNAWKNHLQEIILGKSKSSEVIFISISL